jgi:hypothetical protein
MKALLGLAISLAAAAVLAADQPSLPLEHGVYVETDSPCAGAESSTRSWFGGGYVIQAPHAHCEFKSVTQPDAADYVVTLQCYENGDRSLPYDVVDKVKIVGPREYELQNQFGRFRARWCRS